jgi:dihydroceramidase
MRLTLRIVYYAYQGLRRRRTADASWASDSLYYGLAVVGLCSAFFHGLVKFYSQLGKAFQLPHSRKCCILTLTANPADDTSMQIATSCCLHRAMTFGKSKEYSRNLALILITSISVETVYHSVMDEHVVHELTFLLLIILVANQTRGLINQRVKQTEDKRMLKKLAIFGTGKSRVYRPSSATHDNS